MQDIEGLGGLRAGLLVLGIGRDRKLLHRDKHWKGTARKPSHCLGLLEVPGVGVS